MNMKSSMHNSIPPLSERPRERCLDTGPTCLSLRECLALILGSGPPGIGCLGLATNILGKPGSGLSTQEEERAFFTSLEVSGGSYLKGISGLGPAGQAKLLAAFEVGRRYSLYRNRIFRSNQPQKSTIAELAREALSKISGKNRSEPQEWFGFIPIHRSGELGELCIVEQGARTHVNVDPAELFARVLVLRPRGLFLCHNHPSGIVVPSPQDLNLTEKVAEIALQLGIQLLGHWIVTSQGETWIRPCGPGNRNL